MTSHEVFLLIIKFKLTTMKKLLSIAAVCLLILVSSCSDNTTVNIYKIEDVTVTFGTKNIITESSSLFGKSSNTEFDKSYVHVLPTSFTAYFVSKETKGQYTEGEVVKVINVTTGTQEITIPKLEYTVYVTNHIKDGDAYSKYAWYTWADAVNQLPVTNNDILLFGKNVIDYKTATTGTVSLTNYYSAVMIKNNISVSGVPTFNTNNIPYKLVSDNNWYLLYIRNNNTSTQIPVSFGNSQKYQLNKQIEPNKIYQYTLIGVGDTNGNLTISTTPLIEGNAETLPILN